MLVYGEIGEKMETENVQFVLIETKGGDMNELEGKGCRDIECAQWSNG